MPSATQDDPRPAHDVTGTPDAKRSLAGVVQSRFWVCFGSIWLSVGLPFVLLAGYFIVQERQLAATGRVVETIVLEPASGTLHAGLINLGITTSPVDYVKRITKRD